MTSELAPVQDSPIVVPAVTADQMVEQMRLFQRLKAKLLSKADVVPIQGKPYVKRSGWRKLALAFNISDEILSTEKEDLEGGYVWRIQVRAWAPNGRSAVGIGACSTRERAFSHTDHDVYAIAHTRAKNRAISDLIGSGEVSAEELEAAAPDLPKGSPPNANDYEVIDQTAILNVLERAGLDTTILDIYPENGAMVVKPHRYLGDVWAKYVDALRPLGAEWVRMGKESHWEIRPREAGS